MRTERLYPSWIDFVFVFENYCEVYTDVGAHGWRVRVDGVTGLEIHVQRHAKIHEIIGDRCYLGRGSFGYKWRVKKGFLLSGGHPCKLAPTAPRKHKANYGWMAVGGVGLSLFLSCD